MKDCNSWAVVEVETVDLEGLCERDHSFLIGFSVVPIHNEIGYTPPVCRWRGNTVILHCDGLIGEFSFDQRLLALCFGLKQDQIREEKRTKWPEDIRTLEEAKSKCTYDIFSPMITASARCSSQRGRNLSTCPTSP